MASLNGVTPGGWISLRAGCSKQAGADGLELHIYHAASDMTLSAAEVERQADRHRARGEAQPAHSGRRQARAAAHRLRPFRQDSSTRRAPTRSSCSRAFTASTSTSTSSR